MSAANYSRGQQSTGGENDALYEGLGPVERGIIHFFKTNTQEPDGYHVKMLMRAVDNQLKQEVNAGNVGDPAEGFAYVFTFSLLSFRRI